MSDQKVQRHRSQKRRSEKIHESDLSLFYSVVLRVKRVREQPVCVTFKQKAENEVSLRGIQRQSGGIT